MFLAWKISKIREGSIEGWWATRKYNDGEMLEKLLISAPVVWVCTGGSEMAVAAEFPPPEKCRVMGLQSGVVFICVLRFHPLLLPLYSVVSSGGLGYNGFM